MQLGATQENVTVKLTLESAKNVALQGNKGLSNKNAEAGNASYYYSLTPYADAGNNSDRWELF